MSDDEIEDHKGFWGNLMDAGMAGLDTLGASQQGLYRWATGDDIRKSIPDYMKPQHLEERWDDEGVAHEMIYFEDVVDEWTNGGYENMMEDLNEGGFFSKWVLGGGIKVAGFVADVAFDPMTYVAGLGLGTKMVKATRTMLPAAIRAEHLGKIAKYRRSIGNYNNYLDARKEHIQQLAITARTTLAPKDKGALALAVGEYKDVLASKKRLVADSLDGQGVSMNTEKMIKKPGPKATIFEVERYKARVNALKRNPPMVDFDSLPKREYTYRMVAGPDDAEILNEGLSGIIRGADVDDIRVRGMFDHAGPAHTSLRTPMNGVSSKGLISEELMRSKKIFNDVVNAHAENKTQQKFLERSIRGIEKKIVNGKPNKSQKARLATLKSNLDEINGRAKTSQGHIDHFESHGRFPESVREATGIEMPWGPNKPILHAEKFLPDSMGTSAQQFFARGLYPQSSYARTGWLAKDIMFREPMRVLERYMPGSWDFMRGKMKTAEYHQNALHSQFADIFERHGIHASNLAIKGAKKAGIDTPAALKINKPKDRAMWDLLNSKKGSDEWKKAMDFHGLDETSSVVKAHDEVRVILDDIGRNKLNLDDDMFIDGYITHVIDPMDFDNKIPWEFQGSRTMGGVPWFMKERVGALGENVGISEALDAYTRGVTNFLYTKPMIAEMDNMFKAFGVANPNNKVNMEKFWSMLRGNIEGQPSNLGKVLDMLPGDLGATSIRKTASAVGALTYSAALTGNPRYLIMSIAQNVNTTGAEFGVLRSLKGVAKMFTQEGKQAARMAGLATDHKKIMDGISSAASKTASDLRVLFAPSITDTEFMIRGVTFHASVDAQLNKMGIKMLDDIPSKGVRREIVAQAMKDSESINHVFGSIGKPVWMSRVSRSGSALATQFTSFPFKQTETLYEHTQKNPGFLWDYLVIAGQMVRYGHHANVELQDYVGMGYAKDFAANRDITSMPIDTMTALMRAAGSLSFDATQEDRNRAVADVELAMKNMIPLGALGRAYVKGKNKMMGPVRNSKTGERIRTSNMTLSNDRMGRGNEWLSAVTGLQSQQDIGQEEIRKEQQKHYEEIRGTRLQITQTIREGIQNGRSPDAVKVAQLYKHLKSMGVNIDPKEYAKKVETETFLYGVDQRIRDAHNNRERAIVTRRVEDRSPTGSPQ
jgi:hypothetical protein